MLEALTVISTLDEIICSQKRFSNDPQIMHSASLNKGVNPSQHKNSILVNSGVYKKGILKTKKNNRSVRCQQMGILIFKIKY